MNMHFCPKAFLVFVDFWVLVALTLLLGFKWVYIGNVVAFFLMVMGLGGYAFLRIGQHARD